MKSIKIVKAIAYAFKSQLSGMVYLSPRSVRIPSSVQWHDINVKPHPSMVSATKKDDNNRVVTTTLKLYTSDDLNFGSRHLVFKVTLTDDRQFLIGSDQRPFTSIEINENCPESVKDNQLNEVIISYKSLRIPPYIMV